MRITTENGIQKLVPSRSANTLIALADLEKPEKERYYFDFAYLPSDVTMEECKTLYKELARPEISNSADALDDSRS